jgi:hypothetical protein
VEAISKFLGVSKLEKLRGVDFHQIHDPLWNAAAMNGGAMPSRP